MELEDIEFFLEGIPTVIRRRGKAIYNNSAIASYHIVDEKISANVENSAEDGLYEVLVTNHDGILDAKCSCAYYKSELDDCKHIVAVAFLWLDSLKKEEKKKEKIIGKIALADESSFREYVFYIKTLDYWVLQYLVKKRTSAYTSNQIIEDIPNKKVTLVFDKRIIASASFVEAGQLALKCNCNGITAKHICNHVFFLLETVGRNFGKYYFNKYIDFTAEKNAVLKSYGLTVGDKLAEKFDFKFNHYGDLYLDKKPDNILKLADYNSWSNTLQAIYPNIKADKLNAKKIPADISAVGIAVLLGGKYNLPIWIEGVAVIEKKTAKAYKRIILNNENDLTAFAHLGGQMLAELEKLTSDGLHTYYKETYASYYSTAQSVFNSLGATEINLIVNRIIDTLNKLRAINDGNLLFFSVDAGLTLNNETCKPVSFNKGNLKLEMKVSKENSFWNIGPVVKMEDKVLKLKADFNKLSPIIKIKNNLVILTKEQKELFKLFSAGNIMVHEQESEAFVDKVLKPFAKKVPLIFDEQLSIERVEDIDPFPEIYLSELNDSFLMIKPKWKYKHIDVEMDGASNSIVWADEKVHHIARNLNLEEETIKAIKQSHPRFKVQNNTDYFYLPFKEALEKSWFLDFYKTLQDLGIPVYGFNDLKKFKYNTNKPVFNLTSSSGIDWFDLQIEIKYGDETVPLAALKKAILAKQEYILLKDGSLGILPEEWIKKYSGLFRMGEVNGDNIKISKLHYTLLDELYNQIDDVALQMELEQKKQNLHRIKTLKELDLPANLNATLRDYQHAGYQWMHQLDKLGWGGCLADDMGLGKTLQTLTFLQHCIAENSSQTHLIVCPTSLIYNWESEIQKFTPTLKYHIHYGADRHLAKNVFNENNLIITSYGMVRSDIEHLDKLKFGYLILDESQAIKNPAAQITKAVQILKANNRLILSGTPVQNNTFDLYAQLNFLNPGMLGNMEFFRSEFATPIDKFGDKAKSEELRKLIYPFVLRRTKEQVAKDLPDKTEMVLWCEMDKQQRKIYDYYKNYYRQNLMQRIAEDGMGKSSIYILEGLLKLRQICDSPALLKDENYKNESVKLDELVRELEDNTGNHKVLVFSQFVEMLSLVKNKLNECNIQYAYLDGSTAAIKRKEAVRAFQEDANLRVFLISLKAGGVGLNLTAADYVYLIDPWWNPAAEQQAIDRTHRIGQTNKVFAYKMICKDTVEEKILQLQQKKKALAGDLLTEESGFVKKLTKDDVAFLFS